MMQFPFEQFPGLSAVGSCRHAFAQRIPAADVSHDQAEMLKRLDAAHREIGNAIGGGAGPLISRGPFRRGFHEGRRPPRSPAIDQREALLQRVHSLRLVPLLFRLRRTRKNRLDTGAAWVGSDEWELVAEMLAGNSIFHL